MMLNNLSSQNAPDELDSLLTFGHNQKPTKHKGPDSSAPTAETSAAASSDNELLLSDAADEDSWENGLIKTAKPGRTRRRMRRALLALGLLALAVGAGYFWWGAGRGEAVHQVKPAPVPSGATNGAPPTLTQEEITQALKRTGAPANPIETAALNAPVATNPDTADSNASSLAERLPQEGAAVTVTALPPAQTVAPATTTAGTAQSGSGSSFRPSVARIPTTDNASAATTARPTPEPAPPVPAVHSWRANQTNSPTSNPTATPHASATVNVNAAQVAQAPMLVPASQAAPSARPESDAAQPEPNTLEILLPPGILLPVRTTGTVFSAGSAVPVRLELTRDVAGEGWALAHGTEFYGLVQSSEPTTGRVFITVLGFVEPSSGRLVRLEGSLLGSDGADGVRGQTRRRSGGWRNTLKKVGNGLVDTLTAVATGVSRRSTIYLGGSDIAPRVVNQVSEEWRGGSTAARQTIPSLIEVPAATPGYVLVNPKTDKPLAESNGVRETNQWWGLGSGPRR